MAAISPGSGSRPSKRPKPTQTTKAYRFEPFSRRIARLKIDPVHRISRKVGGTNSEQNLSSHFRDSLEHWSDLNLSTNFTEFSQKASRLCETLPQLLYHADTLAALLFEHIGKRDPLSLEPLLILLAHFAHDLGSQFEKYFSDSVSLVADVAASHSSPEVIEWSFTCLAWIFKFLSRLLVPDLRPLLQIMVPYMGKTHQKEHITRFAAESMAYLLRRAAMLYAKNQTPLQIAITYLISAIGEVEDARDLASYKNGVMTLLSEAIRGVDYNLHEDALAVMQCLFDDVCSKNPSAHATDVFVGIWTNALHHTTEETASPMLEFLQAQIQKDELVKETIALPVIISLTFTTVGTRKASRIKNWPAFNQALLRLAQIAIQAQDLSTTSKTTMVTTLVLCVCFSPLDGFFAVINKIDQLILSNHFSQNGVLFFGLLNNLNPERLSQFFITTLQEYVNKNWEDQEHLLLAALLETQAKQDNISKPLTEAIKVPSSWQTHMLQILQQKTRNPDAAVLASSYTSAIIMSREQSDHPDTWIKVLEQIVREASRNPTPTGLLDPWLRFALGKALSAYTDLTSTTSNHNETLRSAIMDQVSSLRTYPAFLEALLQYLSFNNTKVHISKDHLSEITIAMIDNMLLDDIPVKQSSVAILRLLEESVNIPRDVLDLCTEVLATPYALQSVRKLSMLVRNMVNLWQPSGNESDVDRLLPYFMLGLMSPRSPQLQEDLCQALATICTSLRGEILVLEVLNTWLRTESISREAEENVSQSNIAQNRLTPFQCSSVEQFRDLATSCSMVIEHPSQLLQDIFESDHRVVSPNHASARSLAIVVFQAIPHLAEKRSRQLVPLLLSSINFDNPSDWSPPSDSSATSVTLSAHEKVQDWSRRDRKALLELFAKFQNPRVLFRSSDIFDTLLDVLSKGDPEMQKLALKVIFTWKNPSIRPYEEHLQNLTDDKRFREELTIFFHVDIESTIIEDAHRPELLPVVLRLLYGQMINRSGSQSNRGGQEARRKLILRTLFRLEDKDIQDFLLIGCGPLTHFVTTKDDSSTQHTLSYDVLSPARQYGLLNMVEDLLQALQNDLAPFAELLQRMVMYCLIRAARKLDVPGNAEPAQEEGFARRNRRVGLRCLELLFKHCPELGWVEWIPLLFSEIINPRLEKLPVETAQGVSGILHLFSAWASQPRTLFLFDKYNDQLLTTLGACLTVPSARDEVKIFVMKDILVNLCQNILDSGSKDEAASSVIVPHVDILLTNLDTVLRQNPSRAVQDTVILSLSALTAFATSAESSAKLLTPLTLILRQPSEKVSPQTKARLLEALCNLLSVPGHQPTKDAFEQLLDTVSSLFNYFNDRPNRSLLVKVLVRLAILEPALKTSSDLCTDLNAYSTTRLDEVDYDKRLNAFTSIQEAGVQGYTSIQWGPILPNMMYFCRDEDDFAIRSNAVAVLKMFIQQSVTFKDDLILAKLRREILYPGLKKGLKAASESIRADHLAMLGTVVQYDFDWEEISDMAGLLANNDEEASFFNNALHIQQHRRIRALRRLESDVRLGTLSSTNITTIFLPLLEHFIFDLEDDQSDQNLAGQAVVTVGICLEEVAWAQYRAILRRYKGYMSSKPEAEKNVIKLIGVATNSLYRSAPWLPDRGLLQELDRPSTPSTAHVSRLSKTMPKQEKVYQELSTDIIPSLTTFIHQKDESEISLRIPIAISTVRLIKILPEERMSLLLPPVLLDVSNILKSRVQESRDIARKTLSEISSILGAGYFGFILKELRTSLARGYQLHVLSYTVHSILVSMTDKLRPGELDYCLPTLVAIIMEDIFGNVGQEKSAEDYISKMREVKSSKSHDSMELLGKTSTVRHMIDLIKPIQALLLEDLSIKQAHQVDDLLRRLSIGLSRNPEAGSREILMFCYEMIQEFYRQQSRDEARAGQHEGTTDRFLIDFRTGRQRQPQSSSSVFTYKLVRFALDLLRSILTKHTELMTAENVHGFIPIIGDALVEGQEDVRMSAMRLLSAIIKLPIQELDDNALVYAMQAVKVIKESTNTNTESSQAALKLVTALLRDRRKAQLRDTDIGYLLHRIIPDLDQPDRQGVTFNFIKAVMSRKIIVTELYDLIEQTGPMMVTNQTSATRDAARGVYVHFLLDYPQSKSRWSKQLKFLAKNLDYEYPEGRQSVMEAIHILLKKSGDEIAEQLVASFFIPVLLIISNDDSAQCREMAAALLGQLFLRADSDQVKSFLASLRSWIGQRDNMVLVRAGMQAYKILFDADLPGSKKELAFVCSQINEILQIDDDDTDEDSWEPLYHTLQLFAKLCAVAPDEMMSKEQALLWPQVFTMLESNHPWVQHSAAKLIGTFFSELGRANAQSGLQKVPLTTNQGLRLEAYDMIRILKSSLHIIKKAGTPDDLRKQTVRNVVFLGRCCIANGLVIDIATKTSLVDGDEPDVSSDLDGEEDQETNEQIPAIQYIFKQAAANLRREPSALKAQFISPKASALQLLAATIGLSAAETSTGLFQLAGNSPTLHEILLPLVHLTDPSLPAPRTPDQEFQTAYRDLITSATQVLDLLQTTLGSKTYVDEMSKVQRLVMKRRDERARKRKVERVADPEKYGLEKRRKREGEKRRRKERAGEMRGKRRGY